MIILDLLGCLFRDDIRLKSCDGETISGSGESTPREPSSSATILGLSRLDSLAECRLAAASQALEVLCSENSAAASVGHHSADQLQLSAVLLQLLSRLIYVEQRLRLGYTCAHFQEGCVVSLAALIRELDEGKIDCFSSPTVVSRSDQSSSQTADVAASFTELHAPGNFIAKQRVPGAFLLAQTTHCIAGFIGSRQRNCGFGCCWRCGNRYTADVVSKCAASGARPHQHWSSTSKPSRDSAAPFGIAPADVLPCTWSGTLATSCCQSHKFGGAATSDLDAVAGRACGLGCGWWQFFWQG